MQFLRAWPRWMSQVRFVTSTGEAFFEMKPRPQRLIYFVPEFEEWEMEAVEGFHDYLADQGVEFGRE